MNTADYQELVEVAAKAIGLIVAIFTSFEILSRLLGKAIGFYLTWKERRRIRSLIIIPTSEELARYSVKIPDKFHPEENRQLEYEVWIQERIRLDAHWRTTARMIVLAILFIFISVVVATKFVLIVLG